MSESGNHLEEAFLISKEERYDMTSEEKKTQELNSFRNIPDSFKKIVIVNGTKKPWRNEEGFVMTFHRYRFRHFTESKNETKDVIIT